MSDPHALARHSHEQVRKNIRQALEQRRGTHLVKSTCAWMCQQGHGYVQIGFKNDGWFMTGRRAHAHWFTRAEAVDFVQRNRTFKAVPHRQDRPPLREKTLCAFWRYVDRRYYRPELGTWLDGDAEVSEYGTCATLNAAPATVLAQTGHEVRLFGAREEIMSEMPMWELPTGHDWLVVDDRWIIDIWSYGYLLLPPIYDMRNPDTWKIFPPRHMWEELRWLKSALRGSDDYLSDWLRRIDKDWHDSMRRQSKHRK